jgi:probable F420-dependent oxidoreductase
VIRFGIQLPHYGPAPDRIGIRRMAELIVEAGFDGIWLSDHVVLVEGAASVYPYADDGAYTFDPAIDWYEVVTTLAYLAAVTEEVELGTAVCVLPQRQPVLLAKQLATADRLAGGRIVLGVGAGWLAEEFAALGYDHRGRGARTSAYVDTLRACWTGSPPAARHGDVEIPPGVRCEPTPPRGTIPILVGGNSDAAFRRVTAHGDGWLGAAPMSGLPPDDLRALVARLHEICAAAGRDPGSIELALRVAPSPATFGTPELRDLLAAYIDAGVTRLTFDCGWRDESSAAARLAALAATADEVRPSITA